MKAMNSLHSLPLPGLSSWSGGNNFVFCGLCDSVVALRPRDRTWQIGFVTALVDRGLIPMVGLASY